MDQLSWIYMSEIKYLRVSLTSIRLALLDCRSITLLSFFQFAHEILMCSMLYTTDQV